MAHLLQFWFASAATAALLAVSSGAGAASFGAPVLESGLGETLRIVLPVIPAGRDRLTVDCVKLRSGGELNDISDGVRADIVTTGERQAVVLTTVRPVNELVISVGVSLECGAFFLRRYTFLLDLPSAERRSAAAAAAPPPAPPPSVPLDGASAPATATTNAAPDARASKGAAGSESAGRRARAAQSNVNNPANKGAGKGIAPAQARATSVMRPEDEPGVLPRAGRNAQAARTTRPPLAPPVRSMLKIDLGGIDEFLASQPRLLLEQSTGMRLATDISAPDRQSTAAIAADRGFRQAHARYIAAMRDAPDPVAAENQALGKRLDAFSKDLSSLKLDLQTTRARADALEASRVAWWWLLIAAALAALLAGAGAAWWSRRTERRPAGRLIDIDGAHPGKTGASSGGAALASAHKRDFTATVVMTRAERARGEPDPEAQARASPAVQAAPAPAAPVGMGATAEPPRDNSDDLASFNLPRFDKPSAAPPAVEQAIAAASTAIAAAVATRATPVAAVSPAVPLKLDKNSLTQQLAAMDDLSDEAWASYRHPSDASGVAVPFGTAAEPTGSAAAAVSGGSALREGKDREILGAFAIAAALAPTPAPMMDDLQIDFSLDLEAKTASAAAVEVVAATPVRDAGMISTSDISALIELPPLDDAQRNAARAIAGSSPRTSSTQKEQSAFALEMLDPPPGLKLSETGSRIMLAAMEASAPDTAESEKMRDVMAAASIVMEAVHKLMQEGHPGGALRTLGTYLESAPPQAPPGPWIQLAHTLHDVGMQHEYVEAQELFKERFGADLPGWEAAYELKRHQMGMARVTGIEIMVAAGRGKPELIGRLAGLAYRVAVPPEVLFDVLLHRELLQQVAQTQVASQAATGDGSDHVDISL